MNKLIKPAMLLALCVTLARTTHAESTDVPNVEEEATAKIILTKLDVNDTKLELAWKIRNDTDHDVWICANLQPGEPPVFECFLDKDGRTLVIRRRFDLPVEEGKRWEFPFYRARYARLRPGQERTESIFVAVPVQPRAVFGLLHANADYAQRLALEIGFYNEDLPTLIRSIVELAESLNCDIGLNSPIASYSDMDIPQRFFAGVMIARVFHLDSFTDFHDSVLSGGDEVIIPYYMGLVGQALPGEQVLRVIVVGVSTPYESNYPPRAPKPE